MQIIDEQSTDATGYHHFAPSSHHFGQNIVFIEAPAISEATDNATQTYVIQEDGCESTTVEIIHSNPPLRQVQFALQIHWLNIQI